MPCITQLASGFRLPFQVHQTPDSVRGPVKLKWCLVHSRCLTHVSSLSFHVYPVALTDLDFCVRFLYVMFNREGLSYCPHVVRLHNSVFFSKMFN